ncbi:MAG TPA: hypothetical protein VI775_02335, partial [Candidatus Paceibacterota bacterium]
MSQNYADNTNSDNYYFAGGDSNYVLKKVSGPIKIIDSTDKESYAKINIKKYYAPQPMNPVNVSADNILSHSVDAGQLEENESYDVDIDFTGPIDSMKFRGLKYAGGMKIGVDKIISKQKIENKPALDVFAIHLYDLEFSESSFSKRAIGTELYKCKEWDFSSQTCLGTWEKLMDITPGEYYDVSLYPGDPGFAELGLASINTDKSIYHSGESAEITIVVLDNEGYLVNDAEVYLNVTSPSNNSQFFSTQQNSIIKVSDGIYKAYYYSIFEEGTYGMNVYATGNNVNNTMQSYFVAKENYEFDILRNTPVVVDPWKSDFISMIQIISYSSGSSFDTFNFTESLPESFTVTDYGGAIESYSFGKKLLTWYDLSNASIINYSALPPLITPELYDLRSYVEYVDPADNLQKIFEEARPWYLAVDPSFYYDPTSTLLAGWTTGTGTTYAEIDDAVRYSTT